LSSDRIHLDIVVPSAHANIDKLYSLCSLNVPNDLIVHFYFVLDNPEAADTVSENHFKNKPVTIIKNVNNLGAHQSRNKGFEAGSSEYVLFLDDDVEAPPNLLLNYLEAINKSPKSPGFVGPVKFPPSNNLNAKAAVASDILTFWDIPKTTPKIAWGITANLMVRREAVGDIRFSPTFPKKGGGEDVDFCLRIVEKCGSWFESVPNAELVHPWWAAGKQQYKRFGRWAYGDSTLPVLHPKYRFRNAPNLLETISILSLLAVLAFVFFTVGIEWFLAWLLIAPLAELFMDGLRMRYTGKKLAPTISARATAIRLSNDLGRLAGHLKNMHFLGLTERFDYFMTGEHIRYERTVALSKFLFYVILAILLFLTLG